MKTERPIQRIFLAELFGTFVLTFIDSAVTIVEKQAGLSDALGRSLAPVAVVATMIFLLGEVSGAHINPAVTLAFALRRVFPWRRVPLYWGAQVTGALIAGLVLYGFFGDFLSLGLTFPHGLVSVSFWTEVLLSWLLVSTIVISACAADVKGWEAAFPVGGTLLFCGLVGKEISGASMNPARSLGPALFAAHSDSLWIYLTAPFVGALLGVATAYVLRGKPSPKELPAAQGG